MLVKLEWLGYRMVEKLWRYVKPFSSDTGTLRTDGRTNRFAISISRISILRCWRAIKTFNGESGSSDSCSGCGLSHNADPTAKINKVKDLALIFWSVSSPHQDYIFCQTHLEQAFFYIFFINPFNKMFIVNGKSHCCNDTFTDVLFTMLQAKNI